MPSTVGSNLPCKLSRNKQVVLRLILDLAGGVVRGGAVFSNPRKRDRHEHLWGRGKLRQN